MSVFAFLWAVAVLSHMASLSQSLGVVRVALVLAAFIVIRRPAVLPFLGLLTLHVVYIVQRMPYVGNHEILAACVDLTILAAVGLLLVSSGRFHVDADGLYRQFAPVVRIELLVLYFFSVFHKLNSGYFNPSLSCSAFMYSRVSTAYPFLPQADWAGIAAIYLTIGTEVAIPTMLLVGPLRIAGLLLGFAFHFVLALDPGEVVYNFSGFLIAFFFLFTPNNFPEALERTLVPIRAAWTRWGSNRLTWLVTRGIAHGCIPVLVAVLIFRGTMPSGLTGETGRVLWAAWATFTLTCFLAGVLRKRWTDLRASQLVWVRQPVLLLFPALLFVNGTMPYLGAKTEAAFSMFSNLWTEGGATNHFLVPASWQILNYQRDLVTVRRTSAASVQALADQGWEWTYFEFRSLVRRYPDASIVYERGGVVRSVEKVRDDPELMQPESRLLRKLLRFRRVPADAAKAGCVH